MDQRVGRIFVRRPDGDLEGQLDTFTQFDAIDRDMDAGAWSITGPTTDLMRQLSSPGWGMVAMLDDEEFLAGPTNVDDDTADVSAPSGTTVVSGLSDSARLWELLCYPSEPPFTEAANDEMSGRGEPVMKHYVGYNLLDDTRKVPQIAQFGIAPDRNRGGLVRVRARFDVLGDQLVSIGTTTGLGFDIKNREFDVYERADRRDEVIFSFETGNLIEFKRKRTRPKANRVIVAGGGEGTARIFVIVQDDASAEEWGAYIEMFRDRRDTTDLDELQQTGEEELIKNGEVNELSLRTVDVPGRTYRKNYNKGDIVTAQNIVGTIKQVQLTLNNKGLTIVPGVNSANTATAAAVLRSYDELRRRRLRISHLERSL